MVEVKLSFSSMDEAIAFFQSQQSVVVQDPQRVADMLGKGVVMGVAPAVAEAGFGVTPATGVEMTEKPTTKKARKTKTESAPVVETAAVDAPATGEPGTESPTDSEDAKKYTVDDVRKALQDYVAKNDFAKGTALVKSFGASRITEIPAEKFAKFIAAASAKGAA